MSFARKRNRVRVAPVGATLTEQRWKEKQSIQSMVKRYLSGDSSVVRKAIFADVSELPDNIHDFLNKQFDAVHAFDSLDDAVKSRFPTPTALLNALHDDASHELLREVGILAKPVGEPKAVKVEVVNAVTPSKADAS